MTPRLSRPALAALAGAFVVVAVLNGGGYRYGVGDQAFYIPAFLGRIDPTLFPRDRPLFAPQQRLMIVDEAVASASALTGATLPLMFAVGFAATLVLLGVGYTRLASAICATPAAVVAFVAAMTLRHRITRTGANTLENHFHPRMLAFALGVLAVTCLLADRRRAAILLTVVAGLIHPTTGLWFAAWLAVASYVSDPPMRRPILLAAVAASASASWMVAGGQLGAALAPMDAAWLAAVQGKDYLFPTADWPLSAWLVNLAYPAVIVYAYRRRRRAGLLLTRETGLVAGALALTAAFLLSLPFVAARVALAVQLQISRVFWLLDMLASLYLIWLLAESAGGRATPARRRAWAVAAVFVAAACARGAYVMFVEQAGRPVARVSLPPDEWHDAMRWTAAADSDAHVLADPGHAWKYGSSARVAAARDVYLEEVKDSAMAIYSRDAALRVTQRTTDLGDFSQLTERTALDLAARYGLTLLVSERPLRLPVAYENKRFRVYRLEPAAAVRGPARP